MSFIKTTIAAAALTLVAVSANAQTYAPAQKARAALASVVIASETNAWDLNSPAPFSREGNERFTW